VRLHAVYQINFQVIRFALWSPLRDVRLRSSWPCARHIRRSGCRIEAAVKRLHKLPELARDETERARLEEFAKAVVKECERGAGDGGNGGRCGFTFPRE
jgi:hypothetical protein